MARTLIKNGTVVSPTGRHEVDVLIEGDTISALLERGKVDALNITVDKVLDAKGKSVLEFSEVESGIYEAPKPGEGILFIQNASAAGPEPRTAAQMAGEWVIQRNGRQICALTL